MDVTIGGRTEKIIKYLALKYDLDERVVIGQAIELIEGYYEAKDGGYDGLKVTMINSKKDK